MKSKASKVRNTIDSTEFLARMTFLNLIMISIGNRKDGFCLQLHALVSRQPNCCCSAMLDPKFREF